MAKLNGKVKRTRTSVSSRSKTTKSLSNKASGSTAARKKLRGGFKVGDLITGKDRSYERSIYKVLSMPKKDLKSLRVEFVSLRCDVVERWKDAKASKTMYRCNRRYSEFRKASRKEIKKSNEARVIYFLFKILSKLDLIHYHKFLVQ